MNDAVLAAAKLLAAAGIDSARLDARLLFQNTLGDSAAFDAAIARRAGRESVAAITGHKEFWSMDFEVGPGVLIPRPDTETLIEQALKLAPEDPFIMDSMGWVLFRMNQNDAALTFLKRAFEIRPDAEIAAHLGEVLWAMGRHDEAKKVWASALKESPANELLLATVKKFSP